MVTFTWNLVIIASFLTKIKSLREPAHLYILNLAITDFLLSVSIIFPTFITNITGEFTVGNTDVVRCSVCEFLGFLYVTLFASTLHTLAIISFDRFIHLIKPLTYAHYFNFQKALAIVTIVWIISIGLAIPPFLGLGEYAFNTLLLSCQPRWTGSTNNNTHNFMFIIFLGSEAVIPLFFFLITNAWTYKHIREFFKKNYNRQSSVYFTNVQQQTTEYDHKQKQLLRVFGALFLGHMICWLPVATIIIVGLVVKAEKFPDEIFLITSLCYFTNPVVHPILETIFLPFLRKKIHQPCLHIKLVKSRLS